MVVAVAGICSSYQTWWCYSVLSRPRQSAGVVRSSYKYALISWLLIYRDLVESILLMPGNSIHSAVVMSLQQYKESQLLFQYQFPRAHVRLQAFASAGSVCCLPAIQFPRFSPEQHDAAKPGINSSRSHKLCSTSSCNRQTLPFCRVRDNEL